MKMCYKKLWKLLIDRDLKQKDLCDMAGVSMSSLSKMKRSENINTDSIVKICAVLNCNISDIVEVV